MKTSNFIRIVVVAVISLILYVGLLPKMVSATDDFSVLLGLTIAFVWPFFATKYLNKHLKGYK